VTMARVITGDCLAVMPTLEASSVHAIVCDPPYGLAFMGKEWDHGVPGVEFWREALRVAKPGAHLAAFGGTRTYHRLAVAIEDAGWEIRDCLSWLYGSGFPKSFDVSKGIDGLDAPDATFADALTFTKWLRTTGVTRQQIREATGTFMDSHYLTTGSQPAVPTPEHWAVIRPLITVEIPEWVEQKIGEAARASENLARREVVGTATGKDARAGDLYRPGVGTYLEREYNVTRPYTDAARDWHGWGTALKPAWEPIILARKPLAGTVARNVLAHGTGALNIDGCRIGDEGGTTSQGAPNGKNAVYGAGMGGLEAVPLNAGRWPANVCLDEDAAAILDEASGELPGQIGGNNDPNGSLGYHGGAKGRSRPGYGDTGGASRFFYTAKASSSERNAGLDHLPVRSAADITGRKEGSAGSSNPRASVRSARANHHPTVTPLALMQWLCRLVTPRDGLILDPFCGSGTTGRAAVAEGFRFVGIERDEEYAAIARARIAEFSTLLMDVAG
jgi:DNA modification methylase